MELRAQSIVGDIYYQQLDIWADDVSPDDVLPKYDPTNAPNIEGVKKRLESPQTQQLLKDEIEKLGSSAQEVEMAFRAVYRDLAKIKSASDANIGEPFKKKIEAAAEEDSGACLAPIRSQHPH